MEVDDDGTLHPLPGCNLISYDSAVLHGGATLTDKTITLSTDDTNKSASIAIPYVAHITNDNTSALKEFVLKLKRTTGGNWSIDDYTDSVFSIYLCSNPPHSIVFNDDRPNITSLGHYVCVSLPKDPANRMQVTSSVDDHNSDSPSLVATSSEMDQYDGSNYIHLSFSRRSFTDTTCTLTLMSGTQARDRTAVPVTWLTEGTLVYHLRESNGLVSTEVLSTNDVCPWQHFRDIDIPVPPPVDGNITNVPSCDLALLENTILNRSTKVRSTPFEVIPNSAPDGKIPLEYKIIIDKEHESIEKASMGTLTIYVSDVNSDDIVHTGTTISESSLGNYVKIVLPALDPPKIYNGANEQGVTDRIFRKHISSIFQTVIIGITKTVDDRIFVSILDEENISVVAVTTSDAQVEWFTEGSLLVKYTPEDGEELIISKVVACGSIYQHSRNTIGQRPGTYRLPYMGDDKNCYKPIEDDEFENVDITSTTPYISSPFDITSILNMRIINTGTEGDESISISIKTIDDGGNNLSNTPIVVNKPIGSNKSIDIEGLLLTPGEIMEVTTDGQHITLEIFKKRR